MILNFYGEQRLIIKSTSMKNVKSYQQEFKKYVASNSNGETEFLRVEALEINLPEVFFDENGCLIEDGGFDVIIGNPPWGGLEMETELR